MLNLNRATILGNATRDTEMRYTPNGQAVSNFAVATNRRWKNQAGDLQEAVDYHEIVAWGKLGEIANQIIKKGTKVYVEGRLQTRNWESQDGSRRQRTEIVADNIIGLSGRGEYDASGTVSSRAPETPSAKAVPGAPDTEGKTGETKKKDSATDAESDEINLDDIPF